jgi:hypothetical protein
MQGGQIHSGPFITGSRNGHFAKKPPPVPAAVVFCEPDPTMKDPKCPSALYTRYVPRKETGDHPAHPQEAHESRAARLGLHYR